jgi:hypothetical protein
MCVSSALKLTIDAAVAVGTIAVAVLAIWGDWVRSILAPSKLRIVLHTPSGDPTTNHLGNRLMYYHLKVINDRPWLKAENCRVELKALSRRGPDQVFHRVRLAVPSQYVWAPAELTPSLITLAKERVLDFGFVMENGAQFRPTLYSFPNNFQGYVAANEAVRFHLSIEANNYSSPKEHIFEVAWDGQWSHEPETMSQHLVIRVVEA